MENTVFINGAINQASLLEICKNFRNISQVSNKPIHLVINSPGGDIQATLGIIDCIDSVPNEIYTYALGRCSSAAVFIFLAGSKRLVFENTIFVIHEPFMSADQDSSFRIKDLIFEYEKLALYNARIFKLFKEKTGIDKELLEKKYQENNWLLCAQDCIKLKIATEITTSLP